MVNKKQTKKKITKNIKSTKVHKNTKKGKPHINLKKKAMMDALIASMGNISLACEKVHIDRKTHYLWLAKDPQYKEDYENLHERKLDFYEHALNSLVKAKNVTAIIFGLKTLAKKRGYIEKQEVEHSGAIDGNTNVNFIWGKKKDKK